VPTSPAVARRAARATVLLVLVAALAWFASPAAASPALTADPTSLDFGDGDIHPQNQNNVFRSVTLTNTGNDAVSVTSTNVIGTNDTSFTVNNNNCASAFLFPGQQCQVQLRFTPTVLGPVSAQLDVEDDSGTTLVDLSGNGITGTLSASPSSVTFNPQPWYFGGQSQGVNLNVGANAGVVIESATITGPDASAFNLAWGSNCFNQFFYPFNSCGIGVGFQPPGPGSYSAQLEITNDGTATPIVVPLSAVALNGPHLTLTPSQVAFGSLAVGQDATIAVRALNEGDYQTLVGETVVVTGLPDVFFVTGNACDGAILAPGDSCEFTAHFAPKFAGPVNASIFLIAGDNRRPVEVLGLNGSGVGGGSGASTTTGTPTLALAGHAVAGGSLQCRPSGAVSAFAWLRDGRVVARARGDRLALTDADVGARFACRATTGGQTITSSASAPVRPRDLSHETGAFIDRAVCRTTAAPSTLSVGGRSVAIASGRPTTALSPLVVRGAVRLRVELDGRNVGAGRRVRLVPRILARFGDGAHRLRVIAGSSSASARVGLAPCRLALEVHGGPDQSSVIAVSARAGVRSVSVRLSGLRLRAVPGRRLGDLVYKPARLPARRVTLTGPRGGANGVHVVLRGHRLRVSGLPPEVGVVRLMLRSGVLAGRRGTGSVTATLRGQGRSTMASARAAWRP
jgi:hypothetical protein